MRKLCITLPVCLLLGIAAFAQTALQHPGSICCDQIICPFDPIAELTESMPVNPPEPQISVEYAWFELVVDTTAPTGTRWNKIAGATGKNYQPTGISTPYGGFYMRAARQVGTLPYLFSNIVNVKQLGANSVECTSAANEIATAARVSISPNPATDDLHLTMAGNQTAITAWQVMGLNGRLMSESAGINTQDVHIQVSDWTPGFYFLKIFFSDGKTSVFKWVKV